MNESTENNTTGSAEVSAMRVETMPIAWAYCFFIILGNGLTIASVLRFEQLRTPANLFIASLAGADLALGLIGPYFNFLNSVPVGVRLSRHSHAACIFSLWGVLLASLGSAFNLLAISVDRYVAIMFPLRYSSIVTPTTAKVSIAVVWTIIFCLSLPPVCGWNRWTRNTTCTFSEVLPASYRVVLFAVPVVACLLVLTVLYFVMFATAWKHQCQIQVADPTSGYNAMKGHLRSAKTMCIVLGAFYLCWSPYIILASLTASFGSSAPRLLRVFRDVASFLVVINSGINPCIYAWRSTDFRQAYKKLMCLR